MVAVKEALPVVTMAPPLAWLIAPLAVTLSGPVTVTLPMERAWLFVRETVVLVPVLVSDTSPVSLLAPPRVIEPFVVENDETSAAMIEVLAAWVMLPTAVTASGPATFTPRRARARLFVRATLPVPMSVMPTEPLKALPVFERVIAPFALRVVLPPTTTAVLAIWAMSPAAVSESCPATLTAPSDRAPL